MTEREKLLAEIEALKVTPKNQGMLYTMGWNNALGAVAALPFFAPESAPAAGESGEEKPALIECDRCDGTGFYEGGKTMLTRCEVCNGTGAVRAVTP
jgi:hypothetical protein